MQKRPMPSERSPPSHVLCPSPPMQTLMSTLDAASHERCPFPLMWSSQSSISPVPHVAEGISQMANERYEAAAAARVPLRPPLKCPHDASSASSLLLASRTYRCPTTGPFEAGTTTSRASHASGSNSGSPPLPRLEKEQLFVPATTVHASLFNKLCLLYRSMDGKLCLPPSLYRSMDGKRCHCKPCKNLRRCIARPALHTASLLSTYSISVT